MKTISLLLLLITGLCWGGTGSVKAAEAEQDFAVWREALRAEALAAGISSRTLAAALADLDEPLPAVIALDRKQPEFSETLENYLAARVSPGRIARGKEMLARYPTWLGRVEAEYGVQRRFIVALWGLETNYGQYTGGFPVIRSLATLAFDGRRAAYFRQELFQALRILDTGQIPLAQMQGSWAGAMGQCQFMPSSYLRFAVDADGNGRRNIWSSVPDVLASTAHYLARAGWKDDQTWGRAVRLPKNFDHALAGLETRLSLARWQTLGIRRSDGRPLPRRDLNAALILPDGPDGPAYLVYDNFRALLAWNRSQAFAVAVGTLADQLAAASP